MGGYNRTSRLAAQPAKIYLAQPPPGASVEKCASVEGTLFYTGTPGVDDDAPVQRYDYTIPLLIAYTHS